MSRPLVHAYLGDRRGLLDAVQVHIIGRLDGWVDARVACASGPKAHLRELTAALLSFVESEGEAWGVLLASGGLDHPALHQLKGRWVEPLVDGLESRRVGAQAAVAALVSEAGGWVARGTAVGDLERVLATVLDAPVSPSPDQSNDPD